MKKASDSDHSVVAHKPDISILYGQSWIHLWDFL